MTYNEIKLHNVKIKTVSEYSRTESFISSTQTQQNSQNALFVRTRSVTHLLLRYLFSSSRRLGQIQTAVFWTPFVAFQSL